MPTPRAKTLMSLFGLKYPIFEAPHGRATRPELAIAVSNAGAMGALALAGRSLEDMRTWVSRVKGDDTGPFAKEIPPVTTIYFDEKESATINKRGSARGKYALHYFKLLVDRQAT